jgi:hypothetical protein
MVEGLNSWVESSNLLSDALERIPPCAHHQGSWPAVLALLLVPNVRAGSHQMSHEQSAVPGKTLVGILMALTLAHCVRYDDGGSDAFISDACNGGVECNYDVVFYLPPMYYLFYFYDYVCAGESPPRIPKEALPNEGCVLLLVSLWHDIYDGCEGHCIRSGWFCHHVDVERNVATVYRKYSEEEHPFDFAGGDFLPPGIERTVPGGTARYILVERDEWEFRNPPVELKKTLLMATCERCTSGTYITLPLE